MPRLWPLARTDPPAMILPTRFRLLFIPAEGNPRWLDLPVGTGRSVAVKKGQDRINRGLAKVVVVYRGEKPTQLLVYRPQTYVHLERI